MARWILHVDVDAFFASVEQALNPALMGKPVIVGGDGEQRTVVASCSYEARRAGVRTAMRSREARALCPEAVFIPGDYRVYRQAAEAVFRRLRMLSPRVQPVSLDEAFVDLRVERPLSVAEGLCRRVWRELRLPLSVGIADTLLVAKIATALAKPRGCFWVRPGYARRFVERLAVERLPGVGPRTAQRLADFNIRNVHDLARVPLELLEETFGKRGANLHAFAHGNDPREVEERRRPLSISRESSLEEPATRHGLLLGMASYLLERAMKEVLAHGLRTRCVTVKLRYVDGVAVERARTLSVPTAHEANLVPVVDVLLRELFTRRVGVHLVGVALGSLVSGEVTQRSLFESDAEDRAERLADAVARIRERHGFGAVLLGPALELVGRLPRDRDGFRLRISSLTR